MSVLTAHATNAEARNQLDQFDSVNPVRTIASSAPSASGSLTPRVRNDPRSVRARSRLIPGPYPKITSRIESEGFARFVYDTSAAECARVARRCVRNYRRPPNVAARSVVAGGVFTHRIDRLNTRRHALRFFQHEQRVATGLCVVCSSISRFRTAGAPEEIDRDFPYIHDTETPAAPAVLPQGRNLGPD